MGVAVNVEEFVKLEAGQALAAAGRFVKPWSGVVSGSSKYQPGGDALVVPDGVLVALIVIPEFDGDALVAWNGDSVDPRVRVFVRGEDGVLREATEGSDQSAVLRRCLAFIAD